MSKVQNRVNTQFITNYLEWNYMTYWYRKTIFKMPPLKLTYPPAKRHLNCLWISCYFVVQCTCIKPSFFWNIFTVPEKLQGCFSMWDKKEHLKPIVLLSWIFSIELSLQLTCIFLELSFDASRHPFQQTFIENHYSSLIPPPRRLPFTGQDCILMSFNLISFMLRQRVFLLNYSHPEFKVGRNLSSFLLDFLHFVGEETEADWLAN